MTTATFDVVTTDHGLGYNRPQRMGRRLWLPMFLMALMAFPVAWVLGVVASNTVATAGEPADLVDVARLRHLVPAFGFIGFTAVFSAISFAIARILGAFRKGGGEVQEAIGGGVQTLRMPWTAKVFTAFMAMGMMTVLGAVVLHLVAAAAVDAASVDRALGEWAAWLEGFRRLGIGMFLVGIVFGLGTIIHVLRFQAIRIRELADRVA